MYLNRLLPQDVTPLFAVFKPYEGSTGTAWKRHPNEQHCIIKSKTEVELSESAIQSNRSENKDYQTRLGESYT